MSDALLVLYSNAWLTWCLAWGIWPICWLLTAVLTTPFNVAFKAYNRKKRSENIITRGWPTTPLMDADGDIIHPPVKTE